MERRKFIKSAGIAGILASGTAPAIVNAQEQVRWRLTSSFPKALDTIHGAADVFAKLVSDASGGKFQVSVHAPGELVPAFGVVDAVQQGTVECGHTCGYYFFGKDETFAIDTAIPFGMNSRSLTAWFYDGNGLKLMREFFAGYNIVNFPMGNSGAQMGGWYRKEIKTPADLNGLKMRIGGFAGRVVSKLGGVPQNIPGGEIYQALERGTIDATEWVGPYDDLKLGFHKVAPFYYYPGWWEGGAQISLYVNDKAYNALSPEYKTIVQIAASHAHVNMQAMYDARNPTALKQLIAEGAKLQRFPREVMDAALKARNEVYKELNDTNANWRKVFADYERFMRDQYQWIPLADGSYDQYMAAQKL
ncbi:MULTISPECIES: TRAP transporter substrate-binding protein [unclassified Thauera]|uniref:TRAP transporter substrate-binding protein n=1 Tax=unclassified Thauera TaxID=2609274 RepID=UPI0002CFB2B2|nr:MULTISPECIES: TRAP transporter substrate-binding protein [unclassified Thauera]ENO91416.1 exported solute binding protein [Thauera sp. 28]WBL65384.1 TRAP transporter substrate-binding protein [Thauera sp. WB-2]HNR59860.1 TRAP transporter substrate-binding protein [Thauera sp.]HNS91632.1 TRAP transporter substrate-binding protein [Thauera sp.]